MFYPFVSWNLLSCNENYLYNLYFLLTTWNEKTSWDTKVTRFSYDIHVYDAYQSINLHHMLVACIRVQKQPIWCTLVSNLTGNCNAQLSAKKILFVSNSANSKKRKGKNNNFFKSENRFRLTTHFLR